jgi:ThiF family
VSLPRFSDRVLDAAVPALGAISRDVAAEKLSATSVTLHAGVDTEDPAVQCGYMFAANLFARLYPAIALAGPQHLVKRASNEITMINPLIELVDPAAQTTATLNFQSCADGADRADGQVAVAASGWSVHVDPVQLPGEPTSVPAALAAAAIGVAEVFRVVFAEELGRRGRYGAQPGIINLLTLDERQDIPPLSGTVDLGEFALVGAGAIGQAAAHTLALSGAHGTMLAVDDEPVALSNLQRYVLARDGDVNAVKVDLLAERLSRTNIDVVPVKARWHSGLADVQRRTLVALDSPEDRIAVQASFPGPIYNAFTQPADIGFSRHERFGTDPCLACLYVPSARGLSLHEQIATAFRQHPLRVLAYLIRGLPVGVALPADAMPAALPDLPIPEDAAAWTAISLLADIAAVAGVPMSRLDAWHARPLTDLYTEGICGGALLALDVGSAPKEALVPLAHQSALAGVMLAVQLIAACTPALADMRPAAVEGRYDVLAGLPQVLARPRARTPECICSDPVYLDVYRDRSISRQPAQDAGKLEYNEPCGPHEPS